MPAIPPTFSGLSGHPCCDATNSNWTNPNAYRDTCDYVNHLIPEDTFTQQATQSGNWSDPNTWGGTDPSTFGPTDIVFIPNSYTVTVDQIRNENILALVVDGLLTFNPNVNTQLIVNTIVNGRDINTPGNPQGEICIGIPSTPISSGFTATLQFPDLGTLQTLWPNDYTGDQVAIGLISMGVLSIVGTPITPYVAMSNVVSGATTLNLLSSPTGWAVGHTLLLPGTSQASNQSEKVRIRAINGTTITLATPTVYAHTVPTKGGNAYVANTYRNVVVQGPSNPANNFHRAHVMQMHNNACQIQYASFFYLGRTDKRIPIDDGDPANGIRATNHRARYSLHFHRTYFTPGFSTNDPPILCQYNYLEGGPGWGYVNHSSNVSMDWNVGYNVFGAIFVTEAANELGQFTHCLADTSPGVVVQNSFIDLANRFGDADFAFNGVGFWLEGADVAVENCFAFNAQIGIAYYTLGLDQPDIGTTRLWNGHSVQNEPLTGTFSNNTAGNCHVALELWWRSSTPTSTQQFNGMTGFNIDRFGIYMVVYTQNIQLTNITMLGIDSAKTGIFCGPGYTSFISVDTCDVEGFAIGISCCSFSTATINNSSWNCPTAIYFPYFSGSNPVKAGGVGRYYTFTGTCTFGSAVQIEYSMRILALAQWVQYLGNGTAPLYPNTIFYPDQILLVNNQQLYNIVMPPNYVPFPASDITTLPTELGDLTNAQLYADFGVTTYAIQAPNSAQPANNLVNCLIGGVQAIPLWAKLNMNFQQTAGANFTLLFTVYNPANNNSETQVQQPNFSLEQGWNLVTTTWQGTTFSWLMFGKTANQVIQTTPSTSSIDPAITASNTGSVTGSGGSQAQA